MISIIILFCDKDVKYLKRCLESITKHLFLDYEVILVDNRTNNSEPLDSEYKIITKGYNTYLLEGRRLGLDNANGKYVWFIDVDDTVEGFLYDEDIKHLDNDLIQFFYICSNNKINPPKPYTIKNNPRCLGRNVWSRFFKREKLIELLAPIKRDIDLVNYEDGFLTDLYFGSTEDYYFLNKVLYKYNLESSQHFGTLSEVSLIGQDNLDYLYSFVKDGNKYLKMAKEENAFLLKKLMS